MIKLDFVLISVHLHYKYSIATRAILNADPEKYAHIFEGTTSWGQRNERKRSLELKGIYDWIEKQTNNPLIKERDFLIIGDMNIKNSKELARQVKADYKSLNGACLYTNATYENKEKCYDQVFYKEEYLTELDRTFGFKVINMVSLVKNDPKLEYSKAYFRYEFSDHFPIMFRLANTRRDDD